MGLLDAPQRREIPAGQRIAPPEGKKEMYILLSGAVEVFIVQQGGLAAAGVVEPGRSFGARDFFWEEAPSLYRAREGTAVYVVTEDNFAELAQRRPDAALQMIKDACEPPKAVSRVIAAPQRPAPQRPVVKQQYVPEKKEAPRKPQAGPPAAAPQRDTGGATVLVLSADFYPEGHKGYPGVVHPEYKQFVYDKEYKCPNCAKPFKGNRIFQSKLTTAAPIRFDMRETFVDFSPEWYDVVTCPNCYFSMLSAYFNDPKNFFRMRATQAISEAHEKVALDLSIERDLDLVFATHYLALTSAVGFVNQKQLVAKLWGNLSWLYEDSGDQDMERFAAGKAAAAYADMFQSANPSPEQEQIICLTIAGMLYRAGEMKDIKRWLFNVKSNKSGKKMYADLADDILDMVKE